MGGGGVLFSWYAKSTLIVQETAVKFVGLQFIFAELHRRGFSLMK
jgi:hypothetical protein